MSHSRETAVGIGGKVYTGSGGLEVEDCTDERGVLV